MNANQRPSSLTIYRQSGTRVCTCEHGNKHDVPLYVEVTVRDTGRTYLADNGYEQSHQPVYEDTDGNEYRKYVTIDYHGNIFYIGPDSRSWKPRPPLGGESDKGSTDAGLEQL